MAARIAARPVSLALISAEVDGVVIGAAVKIMTKVKGGIHRISDISTVVAIGRIIIKVSRITIVVRVVEALLIATWRMGCREIEPLHATWLMKAREKELPSRTAQVGKSRLPSIVVEVSFEYG